MRIGRIVNSLLKKLGYKIVTVDSESGRTFTEGQLLKALIQLRDLYNRYIFRAELAIDEESLMLLSGSMYTKFGTGFYLIDYLRKSLLLEGDVCEFGVGQGAISALLAHDIQDTDRNLWLFDSFQGFAEPSQKDILLNDVLGLGSAEAYKGMMSFPEEMIRTKLSDIQFPPARLRIVPGFIEETVRGPLLPEKVCFAYVDFDFYEPIRTALNFLDSVIVPGGYIVVDDYNFFSQGAKAAADEFVEYHKENYVIDFPDTTGGNICVLSRKK
jgi:hypothetical protein